MNDLVKAASNLPEISKNKTLEAIDFSEIVLDTFSIMQGGSNLVKEEQARINTICSKTTGEMYGEKGSPMSFIPLVFFHKKFIIDKRDSENPKTVSCEDWCLTTTINKNRKDGLEEDEQFIMYFVPVADMNSSFFLPVKFFLRGSAKLECKKLKTMIVKNYGRAIAKDEEDYATTFFGDETVDLDSLGDAHMEELHKIRNQKRYFVFDMNTQLMKRNKNSWYIPMFAPSKKEVPKNRFSMLQDLENKLINEASQLLPNFDKGILYDEEGETYASI